MVRYKFEVGDFINYSYMGLVCVYHIDINSDFEYKVVGIHSNYYNELGKGIEDYKETILFCKASKLTKLLSKYYNHQNKFRPNG